MFYVNILSFMCVGPQLKLLMILCCLQIQGKILFVYSFIYLVFEDLQLSLGSPRFDQILQ